MHDYISKQKIPNKNILFYHRERINNFNGENILGNTKRWNTVDMKVGQVIFELRKIHSEDDGC